MPKTILLLVIILIISLTACKYEQSKPTVSNPVVKTDSVVPEASKASSTSMSEVITNDNADNSTATSEDDTSLINFGSYDLSGEFSEFIRSNPIDRDYLKEFDEFDNSDEFSTTGWMQLEGKYSDIWDKELNGIYNKLLNKLDKHQKELLVESQKGWLQNHLKETEFLQSTFVDDSIHDIGSQGLVNLEIAIKNRLKDRTIQLFEYYYMLNGKVEFLYRGK